jgi:DNA repair protein RadA/Sms
VLSFEGDEDRATRLLRATKNRFGSTQELGVFEMVHEGLREIPNPSEVFLGDRRAPAIGAAVTATLEGARPLLVELQGLTNGADGPPRRTCVGIDGARVAMLLAVLERHGGLALAHTDVFVNVAGGLRVHEPAADLAVAMAIASSHLRRPLAEGLVVVGELGLTGELRAVPRLEARLQEAARLGFSTAVVPAARRPPPVPEGLALAPARTIAEALSSCLP